MISKNILKHAHHHGFDEKEAYGAYKIFFGTLCSEPRLKIVNLLRSGKKNVSEIIEELQADQTAISHDLARLKKCGFVKTERKVKAVSRVNIYILLNFLLIYICTKKEGFG